MGKIQKKEKRKSRLGYFLRNFSKKHRVSVRDQHTDTEISYIYISTLRITLAALGVLLVLFAVVASLVIYTPMLDNMPGNPGEKSREILMQNIMRLDSLENELTMLTQYGENVALVMEGKTPMVRTMNRSQEALGEEKELVPPGAADSLFRARMESGEGRYALADGGVIAAGTRRVQFQAPVRGEVTLPFNPAAGMYGAGITPDGAQQVTAAADGTVIMSIWTPEDDYLMAVQHKDNYITFYKRATQLLKGVGDRVEGGEVIGYIDRRGLSATEGLGNELIFELWADGRPADPQRYIFF